MERRGGGPALAPVAAFLLPALLASLPATAQVHDLADIPWDALGADGPRYGWEISWRQDRLADPRWHADRLGLAFLKPLGERGLVFLRVGYLRLDTGDRSAFDRWPHVRHVDPEQADAVDPDWPFAAISNGFVRPELGLVFPWPLPLVGAGRLGLRAGLPFGTDRLYPYSAACLPLSADWRLDRALGGRWRAWLRAGVEHTFDSSGEELDPGAFPGGWRYGCGVGLPADRPRGVDLTWAARELDGGRHARSLVLSGWLPWGADHRLRLHLARGLGRRADRLAAWSFGLTWQLAGLADDGQQNERPGRQNATQPAGGVRP